MAEVAARRFVLSSPSIHGIFSDSIKELEYGGAVEHSSWEPDYNTGFLKYSYSGLPWNVASQAVAISPGLTVSLNFRGTEAYLIGTADVVLATDDKPYPSWECTIDGKLIDDPEFAVRPGAANNLKLCGVKGLPDGNHTLTAELKSSRFGNEPSRNFWFDRGEYLPSPGLLDNPPYEGMLVVLDNEDPAIKTSGKWSTIPVNGTNTVLVDTPSRRRELMDKNSVLQTTESGADLTLEFVGSQVTLVGWIPTFDLIGTPVTYKIDDGPRIHSTVQPLGVDNTPIGIWDARWPMFHQPILTTPKLDVGKHKLTLTVGRAEDTIPAAPFSLDYLVVHDYQGTATSSLPGSQSQTADGAEAKETGSGSHLGRKLSKGSIVAITILAELQSWVALQA